MCIMRQRLLLAVLVVFTMREYARGKPAEFASPRIQLLESEIAADKSKALDAFWREAEGKCPLVETIPDDDKNMLVTYLWRGDPSVERVEARGGPYASSREAFARLGDSDVWYRSDRVPKDARYVYGLIVKRKVKERAADGTSKQVVVEEYPNDPLNPKQFNGGPVVELPDAPKDNWHVVRETAKSGRVERATIASKALSETRTVAIYTPPDFDATKLHALAIFFDGDECEELMNVPAVFDNLIADKRIPPTVAVMIGTRVNRERDLVFSDAFVKFTADELLPYVVDTKKLNVTANTALVSGVSLGGLTAAYAAQQRPEVFGNVLSQSGAFWRTKPGVISEPEGRGWFPEYVTRQKVTKVRYYLEVGRFEAPSMVENNQRLREVLKAKGNEVTYDEYNGGHDHLNWRLSLGRGLIALLGTTKASDSAERHSIEEGAR
jgi:enterochelin esterase-like enzyme